MRIAVLQHFNDLLKDCILYLDIGNTAQHGALGQRLKAVGYLIFRETKMKLLESAIDASYYEGGSRLHAHFSNSKAMDSIERNMIEPGEMPVFM